MQFTKILTPLKRPGPSGVLYSVFCGMFCGVLALTFAAPAWSQGKGDEVLLEMQHAFKKGDKKRLAALLPQARGHALEPWAAYWELKARLGEATATEVQDFMARYAGTYQEDRLRNDWLLLLGQRRDWTTFAAELPNYRMGDDREVRCYALVVEHLRSDADVAAEVRGNWYAQRETDDGCAFAADRLRAARKFSALDIWRKARLAMEANRPRSARAAVEIEAADVAPQVAEIHASPARYLAKRISAGTHKRQELAMLALIRMASSDPDAAAALLEGKWASQFTSEESNWVWGVIGRQAAQRLQDNAMAYFAKVTRAQDLSDEMLGWQVRAALRTGQWKAVRAATAAMSPRTNADPAWIYWRARALLAELPASASAVANAGAPASGSDPVLSARQRAAAQEARALLESIASTRGFYERLALEALGREPPVPVPPAPLTAGEKATARANPGLARALQAIAMGLRPEGVREWNYSTNLHIRGGMGDRELLAAADLACERQVWDRCINTSERTRSFIDLAQRFPMPYRDAVVRRSQEIGIDPAYVYGLIRQESRFVMDARSGVGASGLMQVMPATARWTAKKIGLTHFRADQIADRDTNIAIGTGYLKLALDAFDGSMALAAAAYNAGPSRPRSWRNGPPMEAAIWAENIPFAETRDYVKKVLANTASYDALLSEKPQSLTARLGRVGPRSAGAQAETVDLP